LSVNTTGVKFDVSKFFRVGAVVQLVRQILEAIKQKK